MDRTGWQNLFKKRFILEPVNEDSKPGEATYSLKDKEFLIIIRATTPSGALRAVSVTDTEECLVINRGQGRSAYVDWNMVEAITTVDA
ncbi:MAG: hypothetical protein A2X35_01625 [Elusimicrobia bacterium GWA2_61_42]|nr:MAG: hypothetical protein A2X35_01625 [Elusimicrobia bacterium GWA2_61_42]OGR76846.1 MAG: hypothetical protein A2X38_11800 [Elusimicrobia bacterium GWC2_61_25]